MINKRIVKGKLKLINNNMRIRIINKRLIKFAAFLKAVI
jgi:hypothetical protein